MEKSNVKAPETMKEMQTMACGKVDDETRAKYFDFWTCMKEVRSWVMQLLEMT